MFSVTHFRSEFIRQSQATIIRKVTMTQFMLIVIVTATAVGLLRAPFWLSPVFMMVGYSVGYQYRGEIVLKRVIAYLTVWIRQFAGTPRLVNLQAEWEKGGGTGADRPSLPVVVGQRATLPGRGE